MKHLSSICRQLSALFFVLAVFSATALYAGDSSIPYGIDKRPMPAAKTGEKLLPLKVGDFTRSELDGDLAEDEEVYATYTRGINSVVVTAGLLKTPAEAVDGVKTSAEVLKETYPKRKFKAAVLKGDPAYFEATGDGVNFFTWTRGKYVFSVDSARNDAELTDFMKAFPY